MFNVTIVMFFVKKKPKFSDFACTVVMNLFLGWVSVLLISSFHFSLNTLLKIIYLEFSLKREKYMKHKGIYFIVPLQCTWQILAQEYNVPNIFSKSYNKKFQKENNVCSSYLRKAFISVVAQGTGRKWYVWLYAFCQSPAQGTWTSSL